MGRLRLSIAMIEAGDSRSFGLARAGASCRSCRAMTTPSIRAAARTWNEQLILAQAQVEFPDCWERLKHAQSSRDRCTGHLVHDEFTLCPVHDK